MNCIRMIRPLPKLTKPKRVAAYARVSADNDAMLHSLSAQISYYQRLIQNHKGWTFAGVYADNAITGTKTSRENFQKLLTQCREGNIDLIITKSVSRFSRNTVALLEIVRELKNLGIGVFFEEQNINTLSAEGELLLTLLASYAQEESLSASENQKWRIRNSFKNGKLANLRFLFGYNIEKGKILINPEQAAIVREIFARVISGETLGNISRDLNSRGITGALGGRWEAHHIKNIITNEKYTGNAILQKRYRNNHIDKKEVINDGQLDKYYVKDTHSPIIDEETFNKAQLALKEIDEVFSKRKKPSKSIFTGKIICGKCGKAFKRITTKKSHAWNCSTFLTKGKETCKARAIPEDILKEKISEVLGTAEFDENAFLLSIDHIEVPEDNIIRFIFNNGKVKETTWEFISRSNSWTKEMREAASERFKNQRRKNTCQE